MLEKYIEESISAHSGLRDLRYDGRLRMSFSVIFVK